MKVVILGSAAGGGFPQWNSNAPGCQRAREGDCAAEARTQASIAVSTDGQTWYLLNASPDLRQQLERTAMLHPREGLRHTPVGGVLLSGGDVDVIAGLLTMRERQPFTVYATKQIHQVLDDNSIFEVLARDVVARQVCTLDAPFALGEGLTATFFAVPGKVPLYLESGDGMPPIVEDGTTVAVEIAGETTRLLYVPGCAAMSDRLRERLAGADLVFFDGTLWHDDEMIRAGLSAKTGRRMGHMSLGDPGGTIDEFRSIQVGCKVIIHMNNSNPVLLADSPERAEAEVAGWIVGCDGMEFAL